jgi:hypothetical protein
MPTGKFIGSAQSHGWDMFLDLRKLEVADGEYYGDIMLLSIVSIILTHKVRLLVDSQLGTAMARAVPELSSSIAPHRGSWCE